MTLRVKDRGFFYNYFVGPECAVDPYTEPSKKDWVDCSGKLATYNMVTTTMAVLIFLIIAIIVLYVFDASGLLLFGVIGLSFGILGYSYVSNLMFKFNSSAQWSQVKADVVREMGDAKPKDFFDDYDNLAEKDKTVKKEFWLETVKKLRDRELGEQMADADVAQKKGIASLTNAAAIGQQLSAAQTGLTLASTVANTGMGVVNFFGSMVPKKAPK